MCTTLPCVVAPLARRVLLVLSTRSSTPVSVLPDTCATGRRRHMRTHLPPPAASRSCSARPRTPKHTASAPREEHRMPCARARARSKQHTLEEKVRQSLYTPRLGSGAPCKRARMSTLGLVVAHQPPAPPAQRNAHRPGEPCRRRSGTSPGRSSPRGSAGRRRSTAACRGRTSGWESGPNAQSREAWRTSSLRCRQRRVRARASGGGCPAASASEQLRRRNAQNSHVRGFAKTACSASKAATGLPCGSARLPPLPPRRQRVRAWRQEAGRHT